MKKLMFFAAIATAFILGSCKEKDRVCQCTYADGSTESYTIIDKTSKKEAKFACGGTDNTKYTTDKVNYTADNKKCTLQ